MSYQAPNISVRTRPADGCAFGYNHTTDTSLYGPLNKRGDVHLQDLTPGTPKSIHEWVGRGDSDEVNELSIDFNAFVVEKRYGKPSATARIMIVRTDPLIVTFQGDDWHLLAHEKGGNVQSIGKGQVPQEAGLKCMDWFREHKDDIAGDDDLA